MSGTREDCSILPLTYNTENIIPFSDLKASRPHLPGLSRLAKGLNSCRVKNSVGLSLGMFVPESYFPRANGEFECRIYNQIPRTIGSPQHLKSQLHRDLTNRKLYQTDGLQSFVFITAFGEIGTCIVRLKPMLPQ